MAFGTHISKEQKDRQDREAPTYEGLMNIFDDGLKELKIRESLLPDLDFGSLYDIKKGASLLSKIRAWSFRIGTLAILPAFLGIGLYVEIDAQRFPENYPKRIDSHKTIEKQEKAKMRDVNKDGLSDLVYKSGEIYLQTKEGSFISYEILLKEEKAKLDSVYSAKKDSLEKRFKIY